MDLFGCIATTKVKFIACSILLIGSNHQFRNFVVSELDLVFNTATFDKEEMVFCYQNCSALPWEKNVVVIEKQNWNSRLRPRICKKFEITRTICWKSKRSEQFFVTECLFILFLEVSQIWLIRTIKIQIGKKCWDLETCRKS